MILREDEKAILVLSCIYRRTVENIKCLNSLPRGFPIFVGNKQKLNIVRTYLSNDLDDHAPDDL